MKPDWKDAPKWAQWLAMDEDGASCWFEHEPYLVDGIWCSDVGFYDDSDPDESSAGNPTLEPRP